VEIVCVADRLAGVEHCRPCCWLPHAQGCVNNSTAGRKLVRFSFPAAFAGPRAQEQSVHLIGSFTGWQVRHPAAAAEGRTAGWLSGWLVMVGLFACVEQ
jgi:hypothetical protein